MNENQKICFDAVYDLFHDEAQHCTNLRALIKLSFPKDEDVLNKTMNELIIPSLEARVKLGSIATELLYRLKEEIKEEGERPKLKRRIKNEDM